jgi:phage terminase small subunit
MSRVTESRALTDQQAAFVREFCRLNGDGTRAAIAAGYSKESAASRSYELRQKSHIQAAIQTELRKSLTDLAAIALGQARLMLLDPKTPAGARVDLVRTVLDRAGLGVPKSAEEDHGDKPIRELSLVQLEAMALRVTMRPAQDAPAPVDAVVERLEPPALPSADDEAERG